MKNYAIALVGTIILALAVFAPSFIDNASLENASIAETQAGQEIAQKPKAPSLAAEKQHATVERNSFSTGKALGEEKDGLDTPETMVSRGKQYLLTQVDNRLKQLGSFRSKVESTTVLSDSERSGLVSELSAEISMFESFKSEINKSATKQDIKNVAEKIKAEWIKSRLTVERANGQILTAKESQIISDANTFSLGIQKRIEVLKASGKATKDHEALLSAYGKKIAAAEQYVESAKEKAGAAASASTNDEREKLIGEKELLLKNAHDNIREAFKLLKEGARNIRS